MFDHFHTKTFKVFALFEKVSSDQERHGTLKLSDIKCRRIFFTDDGVSQEFP